METYVNTIKKSDKVYYGSVQKEELKQAIEVLNQLKDKKDISKENLIDAIGLKCRILFKLATICFLESDFKESDAVLLQNKIDLGVEELGENAEFCKKTISSGQKLSKNANIIIGFLKNLYLKSEQVVNIYGEICGDFEKEFSAFKQLFQQKMDNLCLEHCKIEELAEVFPANNQNNKFIFPSTVGAVRNKIKSVFGRIEKYYLDHCKEICAEYSSKMLLPLPLEYARYNYLPEELFRDDGTCTAKIRFVCSPFQAEVDFALVAPFKQNVSKIARFKFLADLVKQEKFMQNFKQMLEVKTKESEHANVFVFFGLNEVRQSDKRNEILKTVAEVFQNKEEYAIFHDTTGNGKLYQEYEALRERGAVDPSLVAVSRYLAMPNCEEVQNFLKDMIGEAEFVKNNYGVTIVENGAFMGFIGFNEVINEFVEYKNENWIRKMRDVSIENQSSAIAQEYLKNLPRLGQLLDSDWSTLLKVLEKEEKLFTYDYDKIKELKGEIIAKIFQNDALDIYEKGGVLIKYCLLCGGDISEFKNLEREELERRITAAVQSIAMLLDTKYQNPEVHVLDSLSNKEAGGLCINCGQSIAFKMSCCRDFEWLCKAVAHEVYHSLQHTIVNDCVKDWHKTKLGIVTARADFWGKNINQYIDLKKSSANAYRMQVLEADAVIFETLCYEATDGAWSRSGL